jgi:uncharacterized membrane protein HdeD (DUF308 family)
MIHQKSFPFRQLAIWLGLVASGLVTTYVLFVGILSIWVGLNHLEREGYWIPILAGTLSIALILWLFVCLSKILYSRKKQTDTLAL